MGIASDWPNDADGDVFRRLEARAFDFSAEYQVDFNVDFRNWPPDPKALEWLRLRYAHIEIFEPCEHFNGYILFKVRSKLSYDFVIDTQAQVTSALQKFGGVCESWGVLQATP